MAVTIRSRYAYNNLGHPRVQFDPKKDKSLTNQADMEAADINKIMAKYEKTGVLVDPVLGERKPMYGDFTLVKDYHTMLSAVRHAEQAFGLLPANVRNRFKNDPQLLINFLEDPKNNEEAVQLGLKDFSVLQTELSMDGVTRITKAQKASEILKKQKADWVASGKKIEDFVPPQAENGAGSAAA